MNAVEVFGLTVDYGAHRVLSELNLRYRRGRSWALSAPADVGRARFFGALRG